MCLLQSVEIRLTLQHPGSGGCEGDGQSDGDVVMDRAPLVVAEGRLPRASQVGHALVTVMMMMMMMIVDTMIMPTWDVMVTM